MVGVSEQTVQGEVEVDYVNRMGQLLQLVNKLHMQSKGTEIHCYL